MSRKLKMIRRLMRHLKRHPNDKKAQEILKALQEGRYKWKGRSLVILPEKSESQEQPSG